MAQTWIANALFFDAETTAGVARTVGACPVAPPAGGSAVAFFQLGTTAGLGIYFGSGAPTVSASVGSLYIRTDGSGIATRLYVNNGTTTWVAMSSVS